MGILNVTPDSFADPGAYMAVDTAVEAGLKMVEDGAVIIDVGGESTHPGAESVPSEVEMARVLPVVKGLADRDIPVSVDTSKSEVALAAIDGGAVVINDVTGLGERAMRRVCADTGVGVVIMHMQGTPRTMQIEPRYDDVVADIRAFLLQRAEAAVAAGVEHGSIVVDPGIGFGKTFDHNIQIMAHLADLAGTGYPLLVGTSRKGFLGEILEPLRGATRPGERDGATAATVALAVAAGAKILRVHNVRLAVEVVHTAKAMVPVDDEREIHRTRTEGIPLGDQGSPCDR